MYAQAGYFLTGEHRPYNRKQGALDRIQVRRPFGRAHAEDCDWGWGGWEVAARYSFIDLNSNGVTGGRLNDMTLGLNWYLNNYSKVQFNYIRAFLDNPVHGASTADIFGLRAQVDF
jgi:phosphate-selective porin OprO/OprP